MNPSNAKLIAQTRTLIDIAKAAGAVQKSVMAEEVFELATTLSWGVYRFGDDEKAARRRVTIATAGIFTGGAIPKTS